MSVKHIFKSQLFPVKPKKPPTLKEACSFDDLRCVLERIDTWLIDRAALYGKESSIYRDKLRAVKGWVVKGLAMPGGYDDVESACFDVWYYLKCMWQDHRHVIESNSEDFLDIVAGESTTWPKLKYALTIGAGLDTL